MEKAKIASLAKLHVIVFIYGFTAILGKLISISAIDLVWYRMLIATLGLSLLFIFQRYSVKIALGDFIRIILVGFIVAAHWISFFGAIKLSNVSVTLGCLASATLFTSILEPLLLKRGINLIEVLIGFLIILGLYLIFRFETNYATGIIVAIISAFLAGLFTVLNKILVQKHSTRILTIYEMMGGFIGISIFLLLTGGFSQSFFILPTSDIVYLLILGLICTAFAFAIQVDVMKELSAFIVALSINLEPVYGIIMAFIFFGETEFMSAGFYAGTALILVSVFGYPLMKNMQR
ncbi:MAG TPA: EamA family transporter [Bacteroidales bacterium]|nr:EamA family transporter [Bacteroidales bacterium]